MKKSLLLIGLVIGPWLQSLAQAELSAEVKVIASATEQSIRLRWAPTTPVAWQLLNKYGYTVERYTIARNGELLPTPEKLVLVDQPQKPNPLADWEGMIDANDYAAIAAQAIYGETFELTEDYNADIMQVVQLAREQEQRFSFALFAADQSFEVAQMMGLAFIDHTPRKNERYLYRVYSAVPAEVEEIKTGFVYIGLQDYAPLPPVYDVQAIFGDKAAMVSWERQNFDGTYTAYLVEKSTDGKTYRSITNQPIINTAQGEEYRTRRAYKMDSLASNGQTVYYRVRGITAFGEISPPSDSVAGSGFIPLAASPKFTKWDTDNVTVHLAWDFPPQEVLPIEGFSVERSAMEAGPYEVVENLSPTARSFNDPQPRATNYYRIVAYREYAREPSFPVLVQLADSIPPAVPSALKGEVDTVGVVRLAWNANREPDLLGYRVYRSNFRGSEFSQVTREPVSLAQFVDTIAVKTLTEDVYYQITSVDIRFNESDPTDAVLLSRPDVVPPTPPVFSEVKSTETGVSLIYQPSPSSDVVEYVVYRKGPQDAGWVRLGTQSPEARGTYLDTKAEPNVRYGYTITAWDEAGLESAPAKPVMGSFVQTTASVSPTGLKVSADREAKQVLLSWQFSGAAQAFKIYRKQGDGTLTLYRTIGGDQRQFEDENLQLSTTYQYGVQAELPGGLLSKIVIGQVAY